MTRSTRFGIWTQVNGTAGSLHYPDDPPDATWDRNRALVLEAEALGFDATLVAQHIFNTRDDARDQLETWTACAALAALTSRIEIIAAIKPKLFHPVVLAKMATQIDEISRGRFSINLVNAWYKPEYERSGIQFDDHDERYGYGREWIEIVRDLSEGRRVTFRGAHFQITDAVLHPTGRYRPRPTIYAGGESAAAQDLAADFADVWFINGQPAAEVGRLMAGLKARPRHGAPVRFGLAAFVIARTTEAEAEAEFRYQSQLKDKDAGVRAQMIANTDPNAEMFRTFAKYPHVGTNGGTAAGLVGSYDQVAERIRAFADLGIELFMLQFQPFEREMRVFAEHVRPRVDRLAARAA